MTAVSGRSHWAFALVSLVGCTRTSSPRVDRTNGEIPTLQVTRISREAITIDGVIDARERAATRETEPFVSPGDGRPARNSRANATARLGWNDSGLYVAWRVLDPRPESFVLPTALDPHIWERSTGVELMLQPGLRSDNRDYFELQYGLGGARWSTRFDDYNQPVTRGQDGTMRFGHQDWEPNDQHRVTVHAASESYVAEAFIAWSSFGRGAPRVRETWRANFYAFRDGQRDATAWSPLMGEGNFHRASRFGKLQFMP